MLELMVAFFIENLQKHMGLALSLSCSKRMLSERAKPRIQFIKPS